MPISLSDAMAAMKPVSAATVRSAQIPMTTAEIDLISLKLRDQNRINVYPNRFDIKTPYRVQVRFGRNPKGGDQWHPQGYFTDVNVAAAIGTVASKAFFGDKALSGNFDWALAEQHPEFQAWMNDARNVDVIARAKGEKPSHYDDTLANPVAPTGQARANVAPAEEPVRDELMPEF